MSKREQGLWMRWVGVAVAGVAMVSVFLLSGGLGSERSAVALAGTAPVSSTPPPRIVGITLNACAGPGLRGSVAVADKLTGKLTLGLFALEQAPRHLTRRFVDTTERATAVFNHALLAPFTFSLPSVISPAYEVVVLPSTGKITDTTVLVESQAIPVCNTRTTTATTTDTQTLTTTSTGTATNYVTTTVPSNVTVTVPSGGTTVFETATGTTTTSSTVTVTTTFFTTTTVPGPV